MTWLCGVSEDPNQSGSTQERMISSLDQDPVAKIILRVLMAISLITVTFVMAFFSLWTYNPAGDDWKSQTGGTEL